MSDLDRAIDAATRRHALTQYRHAASLDDLTEQDWAAMRAFVTPLVRAALDALQATQGDAWSVPGQSDIFDELEGAQ